MRRELVRAMAAVAGTALVMSTAPVPAKNTSALPPGNPDAAVLARARMLAGYGEPRLALSALRDHTFEDKDTAFYFEARLLAVLHQASTAESLLVALSPPNLKPADAFREQLVRARLLLDAGRFDASLAVIADMDSTADSPYAAYRDLVGARALIASGDNARAARLLERARGVAPEAIRSEIDAARIDVYRSLDRPEDALKAAVEAAADGGDAAGTRRVLKIRFDLASDANEMSVAADAARELFRSARRSEEARDCAETVAFHSKSDAFDNRLMLSCASVLESGSRRAALRTALRALDERKLSESQSEELRMLWGEYHYLDGDYSRAIALARPRYADPELRRRSTLLMARSYRRVGRAADAASTYEAYARNFPNDGLAAEALYAAASFYRQLGREVDRARVLDQLRHAYPSTFHGWAASIARAKELDAAGNHADAAAIFDQWLTRSRRTDEAALFYSARQRRAAGDANGSDALMTELRAVNPYSFYACPDLLAPSTAPGQTVTSNTLQQFMTGAMQKRDDAFNRVRDRFASDAPAKPIGEAAMATERGRFFLTCGLRDWAERELDVARRLAGDSVAESLALARVFDDNAMPWRSVRLYEKARASTPWRERRENADDFRYLTHPVPFPAQVMASSQREGIAPYVIYGMMREESRFETDVVSRAGAVGLLQLMPETARVIARRLDMEPGVDTRLGDPVVNVSIGSWYAADLLREGRGSVAWMLAAYNAGPGAAARWISPGATGEAAIDDVESIDYKETRGYVKRVVESANVYHALYFDGAGPAR